VVQISLPRRDDAPALWQLGAWLNAWENEGYWVIGSGSLTHNLRQRSAQWNSPINPAIHPFRDALNAILASGDRRGLQQWEQLPDARLHHPTPEHFLPLLVAAANPGPARQLNDSVEYGNLAMDVWGFGAHAHAVPDAL
ncbi:MAG: dioxygenase, partial [Gammaproteobacteria bacterium]|nr:dioxygenase [Gammaproteobacteria bacterium]